MLSKRDYVCTLLNRKREAIYNYKIIKKQKTKYVRTGY
jgi:hypothetical protein